MVSSHSISLRWRRQHIRGRRPLTERVFGPVIAWLRWHRLMSAAALPHGDRRWMIGAANSINLTTPTGRLAAMSVRDLREGVHAQ